MARRCARPQCAASATATLSYNYGERTVWIEALVREPHPMVHDLCEEHAATLRVPRGWTEIDLRTGERPSASASAPASPVLPEAPAPGTATVSVPTASLPRMPTPAAVGGSRGGPVDGSTSIARRWLFDHGLIARRTA
ncbi:MAG: DUF3499 family protein [Microthrixaceae bacterium]